MVLKVLGSNVEWEKLIFLQGYAKSELQNCTECRLITVIPEVINYSWTTNYTAGMFRVKFNSTCLFTDKAQNLQWYICGVLVIVFVALRGRAPMKSFSTNRFNKLAKRDRIIVARGIDCRISRHIV